MPVLKDSTETQGHLAKKKKKNVTEALQWKQWVTLTVSAVYLILVNIRHNIIVPTMILSML